MLKKSLSLFIVFLIPLLMSSCGSSSSNETKDGVGVVQVFLTDAAADYKAVYVTVQEVRINKTSCEDDTNTTQEANSTQECESGWITVAEPNKTYDLLSLQNGVIASLGETNVSTGTYTQLRFILGDTAEANATNILGDEHPYANYLVLTGDDVAELKIPSDKLQIKHTFEVTQNIPYEMLIDFDANKSIQQQGNGSWKLLPVISVSKKDQNSVYTIVDENTSTDTNSSENNSSE